MNIAIIKNNICLNTAVFEDLDTAQQFLTDGFFGDADMVLELPKGYGIGDYFIDDVWEKTEIPQVSNSIAETPKSIDEITELKNKVAELYEMIKSYE